MKKIPASKMVLTLAALTMAACTNNETPASAPDPSTPVSVPASEPVSTPKPATDHTGHDEHEDHKDIEKRSAASHTHGDAELAIVLENGVVTIELDSPLYNILGFEHEPETEEQKVKVENAEVQLSRGSNLFGFNAEAGCIAKSTNKDIHLFDHDDHANEHHDDHDKKDDHDDHSDHDGHDGHDEDTHKDVILQYEFDCKNPSSLTLVNVNLFEFFDELSEIDATYLGPSTQTQVKLTAASSKMDITQ